MRVEWILNELELDFDFIEVDLIKNEQNTPDFLKISPTGQIPAIEFISSETNEKVSLFDSMAILKFLSINHKSKLYPDEILAQSKVDGWMNFCSIEVGEPISKICWQRYWKKNITGESEDKDYVNRLEKQLSYSISKLELALGKGEFICGDDITIADIASFPLIVLYERAQVDLSFYPNTLRWLESIKKRPASKQVHFDFSV
jgi:glutathione S-transferase